MKSKKEKTKARLEKGVGEITEKGYAFQMGAKWALDPQAWADRYDLCAGFSKLDRTSQPDFRDR